MIEQNTDTFMTPRTYQGDVAECLDGYGGTFFIPLKDVFKGGRPIKKIHHNVWIGRLASASSHTPWVRGNNEDDLVEALVALYDDYELDG
jgi:hypothetical protein